MSHYYLSPDADGSEATQVTEDGMDLEETSKEAVQDLAVPPEPQLPSEFDKLFKGCEENPEDFNGWVYLLQYVEQEVPVPVDSYLRLFASLVCTWRRK